jgi:hypothetical protein
MITVVVMIGLLAGVILIRWRRVKWSQYKSYLYRKVMDNSHAQDQLVDLAEVDPLPNPVKQYFYHVLKNRQPIVKKLWLHQQGVFRIKPESEWSEMNAVQYFSAKPRAFFWDANIVAIPKLSINVCDSYIDGKGSMKAELFCIADIVDAHGQPQLNSGALQRYLAESVWFPTALLPSQGVTWEAIDANRAKASITDAGTTVSLDFEFNEKGEVVSVYTAGRYREVNGEYELTGWQGRLSNYIEVDGYFIPSRAEVQWHLRDRPYPYWKADLVEIQYQY